jgi:hypothetical protein
LAITIGSSVPAPVSANTSAVPRSSIATSTSAIETWSPRIAMASTASTPARMRSTATTIARRSMRSASTPA